MSAVAVADRWPLVGRRPELSRFSEALADPECDAFVVHGPAGVGKTRLAEECMQVAERAHHRSGRATASAEAGTVPLAAIAHLLPAVESREGPVDSVALFARAKRAFDAEVAGDRFVLMVDDLHLLDVTSATLLRQLLVTGTVFLVGTVLSNRPAATSVTDLWRGDRCHRVDLDQLPRDSVETLLYHALGAPVDGPATHSLWSTSRGNVLFLRELVLGAAESGALVDEGSFWRLARPLPSTPRLIELVAARIANVAENGRRALELLALCGPLGPDAFDDVADASVLEALEEAGLLNVTSARRRQLLGLAHPVYREVLRDQMRELRRRGMLLRQVAIIERWGVRRREDALRIASWQLEATGDADALLLVQAAHLAHDAHDYPLVVKLARAAQAQRPAPETGLVLGEALFELGSFFEADVELSRAGRSAQTDEQRVDIAAARAANLVWGLLRPEDALAVNDATRAAAASETARYELAAQEAWIHVFAGRPARAREITESLPSAPTPRASAVRALAESYATTLTGFPEAGLEIARQSHETHLRIGDQLWLDQPASHVLAQVVALSEAGRLEQAAECARSGYRDASAENVPLLQIRFAFHCGRTALLSGRARTAKRWFREAVARSEATGFTGPRAPALAGLAVANAYLGDADASGNAVMAMDEVRSFGFLGPERELGRAWWLVARGEIPAACRVLRNASEDAVASGHLTIAGGLLHDIARLGQAASVTEQLDGLAAACASVLLDARADHTRALANLDADALGEVADRMEIMGVFLVAAEAAGAAAQATAGKGLARPARAFAARAAALAGRCEGARTPGLFRSDAVPGLTAREREVSALAAAGVTSRDIAARLFLSVRTVNNHLQRVYAKLGVASREELLDRLERGDRP